MKKIISPPPPLFIRTPPFEVASATQKRNTSETNGPSDSEHRRPSNSEEKQETSEKQVQDTPSCSHRQQDAESKRENSEVNFSHRSVSVDPNDPKRSRVQYQGKHVKIADVMKCSGGQVYKLRPDVSRDILIRTRLDRFLPKVDLQPRVFPTKPVAGFDKSKHHRLLGRLLEDVKRSSSEDRMKATQRNSDCAHMFKRKPFTAPKPSGRKKPDS